MGLPWSAVMYIHVQLTATVEIEYLSLTLKIIVRAKSRLVHYVHEWKEETWVGCCEMLSRPAPPRRRTRTERDPFSGRHRVFLGSDEAIRKDPPAPMSWLAIATSHRSRKFPTKHLKTRLCLVMTGASKLVSLLQLTLRDTNHQIS